VREYVWLDDMPMAVASGGTVYYIHADHLGTPQKLTDGGQTIVWDAVLRPFGETEQLAAWVPNNLRFPGQYFDRNSGDLSEAGAMTLFDVMTIMIGKCLRVLEGRLSFKSRGVIKVHKSMRSNSSDLDRYGRRHL
jgi:hypothetical protein